MTSERRSRASSGRRARTALPHPSGPVPLLAAARKRRRHAPALTRALGVWGRAPAASSSTMGPNSAA
eukprot:13009109-Alexandrium_andersonii.AAC.1